MLYFSELKGKQVVTEGGTKIGTLTDLVFLAQNQPTVTRLAIHNHGNTPYLIPIHFVKKFNSKIFIKEHFTVEPLAENELYVNKNILDQQIIDIKGNKVVRVNDVAFQDK